MRLHTNSGYLLLAALLLAGSIASPARGSSIGVYFAADGSDCDLEQRAFMGFTFYVLADLYGDAATGGITGAEFRVDGVPAGWFATPAPSPIANISIGNPLGDGANVAFPSCQSPPQVVLLYTVNVLPTTTVEPNHSLRVGAHCSPSNPNFACPLVTLCNVEFTKLCITGGVGILNGSCTAGRQVSASAPCTVAVQPATWTSVRRLYAN